MAESPEAVVRGYLDAIDRHDVEALGAFWAPDGVDELHGQGVLRGPQEIRAYFAANFASVPDWRMEVLDTVSEGERVTARWRVTGTFTGEPLDGVEATGARLDFTGIDMFVVRDGRIVRNDAYPDGLTVARQIGMLPPAGSAAEQRLRRVFNARTRASARLTGSVESVADGVWVIRGGVPRRVMNVFLIADPGGGVTLFDAGIRQMTNAVAAAGASLGGISRVVLGHAHADHRGVAPGLRVPVLCHAEERPLAEADHPDNEPHFDFSALDFPARHVMPRLMRWYDGGPVEIAETLAEGDEVSGFRVVHIPGHSPGQIALWRESDRLALTSDCFYTFDPQTGGDRGAPRLPHRAFNLDEAQVRSSVQKIAALEPATVWPSHADALTGDVRGQLERMLADA